jgi:hypothetical protein
MKSFTDFAELEALTTSKHGARVIQDTGAKSLIGSTG